MVVPLRNIIYEKVKESGSMTDSELSKSLIKDEVVIAVDRLNKLLLDLEILGLVRVTWLTKDTRRIEVIVRKQDIDEVDEQNKAALEKDYEASFPGADNN